MLTVLRNAIKAPLKKPTLNLILKMRNMKYELENGSYSHYVPIKPLVFDSKFTKFYYPAFMQGVECTYSIHPSKSRTFARQFLFRKGPIYENTLSYPHQVFL